ncbi:hypothetical protein ACQQ97_03795 [Anaerovoracaceae bacterium SGI.195]
MTFKGKIKPRSKWVKPAAVLGALVLLGFAVTSGKYGYFVPALILAVAPFLKKEYIIDEDGADIKFSLWGREYRNLWSWQEITTLHADYGKAYPDVMLHIGKDIVVRSFIFEVEQTEEILKMAKEKNPSIYIDNAQNMK